LGSITVSNPSGGQVFDVSDYSVKLNSGTYENFLTTTKTFNSLAAGTYYVYVRDGIGCERNVATITITIPSAPTASISYTNISCNGGSDGSYTVSNGSGGSGSGYQVAFSEESYMIYYNLPKTFSGLVANTSYTFRVKDSAGATSDFTPIALSEPTLQTASISIVTQPNCDSSGVVQVSSAGGTFPKTYQVYEDNTSPYNDCANGTLVATFSNVTSGDASKNVTGLTSNYAYCVKVTDANGCITTSSQVVLNACVTYQYRVVDVYECNTCTYQETTVARFPADGTIVDGQFYVSVNGPDGYAYQVVNTTESTAYVYDLTTIYGGFNSCGLACFA
jgi:hypothetical protein